MKVFVSYSHKQGEWVWDKLVPVLRASGADVLIDRERFEAGSSVKGQMDETQDSADRHVLLISSDYLDSEYCCHEMDRAIRGDHRFEKGVVIPVFSPKFDAGELPPKIKDPNPLCVDLSEDEDPDEWRQLIEQCGGELHMEAPGWLNALNRAKRHLERHECVNVVVRGDVRWRPWLKELRASRFPKLAEVDLENPLAVPRHGLISEILRAVGRSRPVPPHRGDDLIELGRGLMGDEKSYIALRHFHRMEDRKEDYGIDLFASLRYLIMDAGCLVLLAHTSERPVELVLPQSHALSKIDFKTVELG